jgi:hypothetical protein
MDTNEQFDRIADLQRQALEPVRAFNGFAVETFEHFVRENFAVLGDVVDYAVDQAKAAGQAKDINDYVGHQIDQGRAFSEKMAGHLQQYISIAGQATRKATEVAREEAAKVTS